MGAMLAGIAVLYLGEGPFPRIKNRMSKQRHDPRQLTITQHIKKQIVRFGDSEQYESRTEPTTVKLTASQNDTLSSFSTATGISKSSVISNSLKLYFKFFHQMEKLIRYSDAVGRMLDGLP